MKKSKSTKIALIIIIVFIALFSSVIAFRYKNAPKTAENTVALYMAKNHYHTIDGFNSFENVYNSTKFKKGNFVVEMGGNALVGSNKNSRTFYAKVKINVFTNKAKIEIIKLSGRNQILN